MSTPRTLRMSEALTHELDDFLAKHIPDFDSGAAILVDIVTFHEDEDRNETETHYNLVDFDATLEDED